MPELPEVETIRRDLIKKILNKKIAGVKVYNAKSVGGTASKFSTALLGNSLTAIERRGKLLIWHLKKGADFLLVHLKMTGQLIYVKERGNKVEVVAGGHKLSENDIEGLPNKHTRVALVFTDGPAHSLKHSVAGESARNVTRSVAGGPARSVARSETGGGQLFFNDLRMFGYMKLAPASVVQKTLNRFGPEPNTKDWKFDYFSALFQKRKNTNLKALLLNQELIAGLGNIYVDEVCWLAGVKPTRRVGAVTVAEQKKLFLGIPKILRAAIKHRGTTFRNFLDSNGRKGNYTDFLNVYGRGGEKCRRCQGIIKKIRAAGRGTHFCPGCQK